MKTTTPYAPKSVLCAVDFSEPSRLALKYAGVGAKIYDATLTILHAQHFEIPPYFTAAQIQDLTRQLEMARASAEDALRQYSTTVLGPLTDAIPVLYKVVDQHPVDAILDEAARSAADLIVLGTHGRGGAKRLWLGSVAENIATHAEVPVFIVRQRQHDFIDPVDPAAPVRLQTVLAPVDLGNASAGVLRVSASIAERFGAKLVPLCIGSSHGVKSSDHPEAKLRELIGDIQYSGCVIEPATRSGNVVEQILAFINESRADLVVLGTENSRIKNHPLLGRTTKLVLRQAPVPVLVVPPTVAG